MVGSSSSKILTVSYGTFSCTLEGFDDPFSTMRHIAEYFRDLAADDRYFGAEPPTPDAEMLHRIAEREIQRRVETRVTGENVVLRQLDTGLAEDEAEETASAAMTGRQAAGRTREASPPEPVRHEEPQVAKTDEVEAPELPPVEDAEDEMPLEPRAGSIEEKLSRIRAVVERTRSRDLASGLASAVTEQDDADDEALVADMSPGFAGDIDAMLISQVMAEQAAGDDRVPDDDDPSAAEPVWDFDDDGADHSVADIDGGTDEIAGSEAGEAAQADDGESPSAGDELAVGSEDPEDVAGPDEPDTAGEQPREEAGTAEDAPRTEAHGRDQGDVGDHGHGDEAVEDAETGSATDAAIASIMSHDAPTETDVTGTDDETPPLGTDEPELQSGEEPEIVLEAEADEAAGHSPTSDDAGMEEPAGTSGTAAGSGTQDIEETSGETSDEETHETGAGEKDTAGEAVTETAAAEQADDEDEFWDVDFDAEARAESAARAGEDEGRAIDLEADEDADWHADADAEDAPKGATTLADARAERALSKSSQLRAPEEESARIVSRTETAFAENAGTRRRSAIAHLKAAVAATRADKILSRVVGRDRAGDPEEQKDYREDLSNIVKPRTTSDIVDAGTTDHDASVEEHTEALDGAEPQDETNLEVTVDETTEEEPAPRTTSRVKTRLLGPEDTVPVAAFEEKPADETPPAETAGDERASPLMLVSELRVDGDADGPVRPRRVSREVSPEQPGPGDEKNFADFAERMGANDLTDLMEAAAAYTAFVEGQPHFSRPQIMRRVANVDPTIEESREAGLRSFGQLLRQGRIQKLQRGQFTVSDSTRFKPAQRIAGE